MGLFDKATSLRRRPKRQNRVTEQLPDSPPTAPAAKGLLQKTRQLLTRQGTSETAQARDPTPGVAPTDEIDEIAEAPPPPVGETQDTPVAELVDELLRIEASLESPGIFFDLLVRKLGLVKAALLVCDRTRGVFAPWAAVGFDKTTLSRLRLNPDEVKDDHLKEGAAVRLSTPEEIEPYRMFFSTREFSRLDELFLLPVLRDDDLISLLLIAGASPASGTSVFDYLTGMAEADMGAVFSAREDIFEKLLPPAHPPGRDPEERLQELLDLSKESGAPFAVARMSLAWFIDCVHRRCEWLDRYRLAQDIQCVLQSLLLDVGEAVGLPGDDVLILLHGAQETRPGLVCHHLGLEIQALLPLCGNDAQPDLAVQARTYPQNGDNVETMLQDLTDSPTDARNTDVENP